MAIEAYTVSYDKANYHAPLRMGEIKNDVLKRREEDIKNGMLRYLAEYRLGVKFDEFFYRVEENPLTDQKHFSSNESGPVRDKFRRVIQAREKRGLFVKREIAECLGFEKLEKELINTSENKLFVWVSPPGAKSDGYGDYSFTFIGQKVVDDNGERKIRVIPYRNLLSLKEHQNYLVQFDQRAASFSSDIDFLANPIVFSPNEKIKTPEDVIRLIGEKEKISLTWFNNLSRQVGPLIQKYLELVKLNASEKELVKTRNAIENYTLSIKNKIMGEVVQERLVSESDLKETIEIWGQYTPPKVLGSCGSSSNSTLMEFQNEFNNKGWDYEKGDCVNCGAMGVEVGPCSICKKCEKEFDKKEKGMLT